jgi:hypothetical protein
VEDGDEREQGGKSTDHIVEYREQAKMFLLLRQHRFWLGRHKRILINGTYDSIVRVFFSAIRALFHWRMRGDALLSGLLCQD